MSPWRLHSVTDVTNFGKLSVNNFEFFVVKLKHRTVICRFFSNDIFALRLWERNLTFRSSRGSWTSLDYFSVGFEQTLTLWLHHWGGVIWATFTRRILWAWYRFHANLIPFHRHSRLISFHIFQFSRLVLIGLTVFLAGNRIIQVFGDVDILGHVEWLIIYIHGRFWHRAQVEQLVEDVKATFVWPRWFEKHPVLVLLCWGRIRYYLERSWSFRLRSDLGHIRVSDQ